MSDLPPGSQVPPGSAAAIAHPERQSFPATRLLYAFGFAVIAWFVFWIVLLMALLQFVVFAVNGRVNAELKNFSANLVQYLRELLGYISFTRDELPFPIGSFPSA